MRSVKSGLFGIALVSVIGVATVVGCGADGSTATITDTEPTEPDASVPLGIDPSNPDDDDASTTKDAGKKDAGKTDAGKTDAGFDAGPPPPVEGTACTVPNEIKTKSCGICGKASTVCLTDGASSTWSPYGGCESELAGGCAPGTTQPCGNCGTQTCNNFCSWGACTGQPVGSCSPGSIELVGAGCPTDTFRQKACKADCTYDNISLTCTAPPSFLAVPPAVGGIAFSNILFAATKTQKRLDIFGDDCPAAEFSTTVTAYNYFEIRNTNAKAATVTVFHSQAVGGPASDTIMASYPGATAPTTDALRSACVKGPADQSSGNTALTGDANFAILTGVDAVVIPAGGSATIYSANYSATGGTGQIKLNVRTDALN